MSFNVKYRMLDTISDKPHGVKVYRCQKADKLDEKVVLVKEIALRDDVHTQRETHIANALKNNPHDNTIAIKDIFLQDSDDEPERAHKLTVVAEKGEESLQDLLNRGRADKSIQFSEEDILDMLQHAFEGLYHLKTLGLVHKDLRAKDIIVFDNGQQHACKRTYKISSITSYQNYEQQHHHHHHHHQHALEVQEELAIGRREDKLPPEFAEYAKYRDDLKKKGSDLLAAFDTARVTPDYEKASVWKVAKWALDAYQLNRAPCDAPGQQVAATDGELTRDQKYESYKQQQKVLTKAKCIDKQSHGKVRKFVLKVFGRCGSHARPSFSECVSALTQIRNTEHEKKAISDLRREVARQKRVITGAIGVILALVAFVIVQRQQWIRVPGSVKTYSKNMILNQKMLFKDQLLRNDIHYADVQQHTRIENYALAYSVAFSPDGKLVAYYDKPYYLLCKVILWNVQEKKVEESLWIHSHQVMSMAFSADGKYLASASVDKTVVVSQTSSPYAKVTLYGHTETVRAVAFSHDGKYVASGGEDYNVIVWKWQQREQIATLKGHTKYVSSVAFSPDGKILASGSWDDTIILWHMDGGDPKLMLKLTGHDNNVNTVAFSPDGSILASGSYGCIKFWSMNTMKEIATLQGHSGWVRQVAFSADGNFLVSCGNDGTVRLWSVKGRRELQKLTGHSGTVWGVAFSQDGKYLVSGGEDKSVIIWR